MATVHEFIEHLKTMPQDLTVIVPLHSEYCILELDDVRIKEACEARRDGWVALRREDKKSQQYLTIG